MALGSRVVVMQAGRVAQSGTPEGVYRGPANRFVSEFLGTLNHLGGDSFCRPEALRPDTAGTLRATVRAVFFEGTRYRVLARMDQGTQDVAIEIPGPPPEPGTMLRLSVREQAVLTLPV